MDKFYEQLVFKRPDNKDSALKFLLIFGTVLASLIAFYFAAQFIGLFSGLIIGGCIIYAGVFLSSFFNYEYEYALTNGELDIDKISGKKRRKHLATIELRYVTAFAAFTEETRANNDLTLMMAHDGTGENIYFADFKHPEYGSTRLLFSPDEKMLEYISSYTPRNIFKL